MGPDAEGVPVSDVSGAPSPQAPAENVYVATQSTKHRRTPCPIPDPCDARRVLLYVIEVRPRSRSCHVGRVSSASCAVRGVRARWFPADPQASMFDAGSDERRGPDEGKRDGETRDLRRPSAGPPRRRAPRPGAAVRPEDPPRAALGAPAPRYVGFRRRPGGLRRIVTEQLGRRHDRRPGRTAAAACARSPRRPPARSRPTDPTDPTSLAESGIVRSDIRSSFGVAQRDGGGRAAHDRAPVLDARGCAPLAGAAVYLWHCDRDGAVLAVLESPTRTTCAASRRRTRTAVTFTSIFPGCYAGAGRTSTSRSTRPRRGTAAAPRSRRRRSRCPRTRASRCTPRRATSRA